MSKISLNMIIKNEALTLEKAVQNVKGFVDEIVIGVDTESSDGSVQIAERLADRVVPINLSRELREKKSAEGLKDWGFSRARNIVIEASDPNSWKLIMDGHEILENPENLKPAIESAEAAGRDGVHFELKFEPDADGIPLLLYRQVRLLGPGVLYANPIHNAPCIKNAGPFDGLSIVHLKKDQAQRDKLERDIQRTDSGIGGLEKAVKANPEDSRSWFYLGNTYKENGRWQDAINSYTEYLKLSGWKEERFHALLNMGTCLVALARTDDARDHFLLALEEDAQMCEPYYNLAFLAYRKKRYQEARIFLEACLELEVPQDKKLFVSPRVYLVDRYDLLSMVYNHLGRYEDAARTCRMALNNADVPRIRNNLRIWMKEINIKKAVSGGAA